MKAACRPVHPDLDGRDAGAASGVVNTAHQLGSALGVGVLVAVSTAAAGDRTGASELLARVTTALTAGSALLAVALVVVLVLIVRSSPARADIPRLLIRGWTTSTRRTLR